MMNNDGQMMVDEILVKQKCTCNCHLASFIILISISINMYNIPSLVSFNTRKR